MKKNSQLQDIMLNLNRLNGEQEKYITLDAPFLIDCDLKFYGSFHEIELHNWNL